MGFNLSCSLIAKDEYSGYIFYKIKFRNAKMAS
jgi:hypothetical protein